MPNFLQKWIYNLSSAAPLCLIFAFVWWTDKHTWKVPLVFIGICVALILSLEVSFSYFRRNLPPISVRVDEISPHDAWIIAYIISYVVPFASVVIDDFNVVLSCSIAIAIILIAPFVNSAVPNPLLLIKGYHFYQVKAKHGVSGYVLISKRKIRNADELKHVKRVFEFLLLDEG
ncbi:MAG: hypothetical protein DBY24_02735 [Prevotellaceae bacterium]|jgi:hypothetical protein|nr:MAG: hypothetical protein DBY24_02735 [Prevotellaceae bacterium]